ncbi:MAG: TolC family protein, partial [Pseudomonadales bacterium]|nr:TolC family protein [Pseudomonadales bacterium]
LAASLSDQAIAEAEHFPRLNLSASGGLQALDLNDLVDTGSEVFSITPIFTWRLLDGRRIEAEIAVADARTQAAAAQYEATVVNALVEAENSFAQVTAARDRTAQQVQSLDSNQEIVALQELRFTAGDINRTELIEAQLDLVQAQDLLETRKTEQATSLVRLFKALGGGWISSTRDS